MFLCMSVMESVPLKIRCCCCKVLKNWAIGLMDSCMIVVQEMEFLVQVRNVLSNLTRDNLFIVVNWWDMVCSEGNASAVKAQHIAKAKKFLTREFAFEEDSVEERIFFISAKEALATAQAAASSKILFTKLT